MPRRGKKRTFAHGVNFWHEQEVHYRRLSKIADRGLLASQRRLDRQNPYSIVARSFLPSAREVRRERQFVQGDRQYAIEGYLRAQRFKGEEARRRKGSIIGTLRRLLAGWKTNQRLRRYRKNRLKK